MTRRVRIGVIGAGFFAQNHLEAWRVLGAQGAKLVAVCDPDPHRLEAAQRRFSIERGYPGSAQMFAAGGLDAVDIVTTVSTHRALVEEAAATGVAVICQKPLADTLEDARAMVEACRHAGCSLTVHENFRYQAPMQEIARLLRDGRIGEPFRLVLDFRSRHDVYASQPYLAHDARFIILDLGVHMLDLARFLMGEARSVACWTKRVNSAIRGEDVATMVLDHGQGRSSTILCSYATYRKIDPFPQTLLTLEGPNGTIELRPDYRIRLITAGTTAEWRCPPATWPWSIAPGQVVQDSVVTLQRRWLQAVLAGAEPEPSGTENLHTLALVDAAYADAARR